MREILLSCAEGTGWLARMFILESRPRSSPRSCLSLLMAATRCIISASARSRLTPHRGLFLAGLRWRALVAVGLLAEVVLLDVFAIGIAGVADACISGGYPLLAPPMAAVARGPHDAQI
jgi:hypothetical protein